MGKYFGTDGFRGEANVNLTAMHAFKVGRFLGWYYGRFHKCSVVIGKDTRNLPTLNACIAVRFTLASPLKPSVPKYFPI